MAGSVSNQQAVLMRGEVTMIFYSPELWVLGWAFCGVSRGKVRLPSKGCAMPMWMQSLRPGMMNVAFFSFGTSWEKLIVVPKQFLGSFPNKVSLNDIENSKHLACVAKRHKRLPKCRLATIKIDTRNYSF